MIPLTDDQYSAIGRVAVESGTLEREVQEYIGYFQGAPVSEKTRELTLTKKLILLRNQIAAEPSAILAKEDFEYVFGLLSTHVTNRNTAIHGVWSAASNAPRTIDRVTAQGRKGLLHADKIRSVAKDLRLARKALLSLIRDHVPRLPITKRPHKSGSILVKGLRKQVANRMR